MKINTPDITEKLQHIKLLLLDVDGVLTDGGVYMDANGVESKKFNAKDGVGIKALLKQGIQVGIISAAKSKEIVLKRAEMLDIKLVYVGMEEKLTILEQWMQQYEFKKEEVAYIGDDIIDYQILKNVGISACPADAHESIIDEVDIILNHKGGEGCVREFIDLLL